MTSITATPARVASPSKPPVTKEGGGVQGVIGDALRASAAGFAQAGHRVAVQSDRASIYPFESVITGTALLKSKTANVKGLSKVTGMIHTIAGFGMLIGALNTSGTLQAPSRMVQELANHVADLIDGKKTARGWSLGWLSSSTNANGAAGPIHSSVGAR